MPAARTTAARKQDTTLDEASDHVDTGMDGDNDDDAGIRDNACCICLCFVPYARHVHFARTSLSTRVSRTLYHGVDEEPTRSLSLLSSRMVFSSGSWTRCRARFGTRARAGSTAIATSTAKATATTTTNGRRGPSCYY